MQKEIASGTEAKLRTCPGDLGTADQLIIDNAIIDEVRNQQRNEVVTFHDYDIVKKVYDIVRHG